jgi:hypothetical protein
MVPKSMMASLGLLAVLVASGVPAAAASLGAEPAADTAEWIACKRLAGDNREAARLCDEAFAIQAVACAALGVWLPPAGVACLAVA